MSEDEIKVKPTKEDFRAWLQIQWQDIHHSRSQEWQCLQIVTFIFLGLMGLSTLQEIRQRSFYYAMAAIFTALLGFAITWRHRNLFNERMTMVNRIEKLGLGLDYESFSGKKGKPRRSIGPFRLWCTSFFIATIYLTMIAVATAVCIMFWLDS